MYEGVDGYVHMYICTYRCPRSLAKGVRSPRFGVAGDFEPPDVDAENNSKMAHEQYTHATSKPSLQPCTCYPKLLPVPSHSLGIPPSACLTAGHPKAERS